MILPERDSHACLVKRIDRQTDGRAVEEELGRRVAETENSQAKTTRLDRLMDEHTGRQIGR
jgi:hypothetical protein